LLPWVGTKRRSRERKKGVKKRKKTCFRGKETQNERGKLPTGVEEKEKRARRRPKKETDSASPPGEGSNPLSLVWRKEEGRKPFGERRKKKKKHTGPRVTEKNTLF